MNPFPVEYVLVILIYMLVIVIAVLVIKVLSMNGTGDERHSDIHQQHPVHEEVPPVTTVETQHITEPHNENDYSLDNLKVDDKPELVPGDEEDGEPDFPFEIKCINFLQKLACLGELPKEERTHYVKVLANLGFIHREDRDAILKASEEYEVAAALKKEAPSTEVTPNHMPAGSSDPSSLHNQDDDPRFRAAPEPGESSPPAFVKTEAISGDVPEENEDDEDDCDNDEMTSDNRFSKEFIN